MTDKTLRRRLLATGALIVMAALAGQLSACGGNAPEDDDDDRPAPAAQAKTDFVPMSAEVARKAGIEFGEAGPGTIFDAVELQGTVVTDPSRVRRVEARYPGVVRDVRVRVGEKVTAGALLATVESDESLQAYAIQSPIAGVVSDLGTAAGDHTGNEPMMTIVDLSHVWVEVPLFSSDTSSVRSGMPAEVRSGDGISSAEGTISYISPLASPASQTTVARVVVANQDGRWMPGMSAVVRVHRGTLQVPVIVRREALQQYEGKPVVFVKTEGGFRPQPVVLGIDDGESVEVRSGLKAGDAVIVTNSYVVLAELEKGNVSDDD